MKAISNDFETLCWMLLCLQHTKRLYTFVHCTHILHFHILKLGHLRWLIDLIEATEMKVASIAFSFFYYYTIESILTSAPPGREVAALLHLVGILINEHLNKTHASLSQCKETKKWLPLLTCAHFCPSPQARPMPSSSRGHWRPVRGRWQDASSTYTHHGCSGWCPGWPAGSARALSPWPPWTCRWPCPTAMRCPTPGTISWSLAWRRMLFLWPTPWMWVSGVDWGGTGRAKRDGHLFAS